MCNRRRRENGLRVRVWLMVDIQNTDWSLYITIVHAALTVARRRFSIRTGLVDSHRIRVWYMVGIDGRNIFLRSSHVVLHGNLLVVVIVTTSTTLIFYSFGLETLSIRWKIAIVVDSRRNTMKFQSDTSRTWPGIGCRSVAFYLPSPASFASSHHYTRR
jgi:hypothetical protein